MYTMSVTRAVFGAKEGIGSEKIYASRAGREGYMGQEEDQTYLLGVSREFWQIGQTVRMRGVSRYPD